MLPETLRAREKSWPSARSILKLMGMGAGPSCEDFTRAEMLEAVNADFMPLEVTVTVSSVHQPYSSLELGKRC